MVGEQKHSDLWLLCEEVYDSFNPNTHSIDSHAEEFLLQKKKINDEFVSIFVRQVFFGVKANQRMLEAVVEGFFVGHKEALRSDCTRYLLIAYLGLIRLGELSMLDFKRLVWNSLPNQTRLYIYLGFIFDENNIETYFVPEWMKIYDPSYIRVGFALAPKIDGWIASTPQKKKNK